MRLSTYSLLLPTLLFASLVWPQSSSPYNQPLDENAQEHVEDSDPTIDEYKEAIVGFFQQMAAAGYGNETVVVFGGMSLWNHFPNFRYTPDVDIQIYEPDETRLQAILEEMEINSGGKLSWKNDKDLLFWNAENGRQIFIDIGYLYTGEMFGIGMTDSASTADSVISPDSIPFSTPEEMFVIKVCVTAIRRTVWKMWQDVADAEFIAESVHRLKLVGDPIDKAYECLDEFLPKSKYSEEWWYEKLGLFNKTCTFADWFALEPHDLIGVSR